VRVESVIRWFMPKEERFHVLLARDTDNLQRAARVFAEIVNAPSLEQRRVKAVELKAIEHEGDTITHEIFDALNSTFITPLDREDIRAIATDLDDILDYLEGVARYLILFGLEEMPEPLQRFAAILQEMVAEIAKITRLIWDLANERAIHAAIVRISDLENQADALYYTVIAELFQEDARHPVELMKWKEIYQGLEDACDQCKDYTHVVGNVVVKNA
jgi:predicted phosphate transport protein (TIGR00153 family)